MQYNLKAQIVGAAKWSTITEIGTKLIAPITNAILARILMPEAFGVVATLVMVTSFAEIFTDAGFQKYLVQHDFCDDDDLNRSTDVAFWTNIAFSLVLWIIIGVMATPIAQLVGAEGHECAIVIMSAEIPLLAFSSIQMARYRREFDFKNLFVARMMVAFVPLVITVPAALIFRSYWALVIGTLVKDVLNAVVLTMRSNWKPRFRYDFQKLKDMMSFSIWTVLENVSIWMATNAGTITVGALLGAYYLGLYKTTITTISGYFGIVQSAAMPVLFSALSRCQDDAAEFKNIYFKFQRNVAILVLPLGFGLFVYHELGVWILLGSQWIETASFLGMNALTNALLLVFSYFNSEAFRSRGKPLLSLLAQIIYLLFLIPALYMGARHGYPALTVMKTLVSFVLIGATTTIAYFSLRISLISCLKNVYPALVCSAIMGLFGAVIRTVFNGIAWEVFSVFLCVLIYAILMMILPKGREQLMQFPVIDKIIAHFKKS